jgi:hypothetical protein
VQQDATIQHYLVFHMVVEFDDSIKEEHKLKVNIRISMNVTTG